MRIGIAREIKKHEYRVGLTPANARAYINAGHEVMVEEGAGINAGFTDEAYVQAGAVVESSRQQLFDRSDMIIKVKEPHRITSYNVCYTKLLRDRCFQRGLQQG